MNYAYVFCSDQFILNIVKNQAQGGLSRVDTKMNVNKININNVNIKKININKVNVNKININKSCCDVPISKLSSADYVLGKVFSHVVNVHMVLCSIGAL